MFSQERIQLKQKSHLNLVEKKIKHYSYSMTIHVTAIFHAEIGCDNSWFVFLSMSDLPNSGFLTLFQQGVILPPNGKTFDISVSYM